MISIKSHSKDNTMSQNNVKLAVIPAAGLGTRMLPIAHAVCKEMLPIVDRPAISYLVEEAVNSGITDILVITNRDKEAIEDYFDFSPEYETRLTASGKLNEVRYIRDTAESANIYFLRQHEAKGLGHAVRRAKSFTGNDPFIVMYGDDIIFSKKPVCTQLAEAYDKYNLPSAAVKEVPVELVKKYCTLGVNRLSDNIYRVFDMIEKPKDDQIMSLFSVLGRVLLTPVIYDILDDIPYGAGGELQLTDAMGVLSRSISDGGMTAVDFEGKRYDMGSKLGFLMANIDRGVMNEALGDELKAYIRNLVANDFNIQ